MKKIFYEKIQTGKTYKYVPVSEYNNDLLDSFTKGNHLVMCYPGGTSRRFNIEPALAPMIAAGRYAQDAMCQAMAKASELQPQKTPITPGQLRAWKTLAKEFGDELCTLRGLCMHDVVEAGINSMQAEADKLMTNAAVRDAWAQFQMVAKLSYVTS